MANLAKSIVANADTDEHDLSGYGPDDCVELAEGAFKDPILCEKMIRLTFVCGGGKKVRQKYSPDLPKMLCDALRGIGYNEDKGAAIALECQGTFKYQHDTGKDLIYVHVFPRVQIKEAQDDGLRLGGYSVENMPPEIKCTVSEMDTFLELVKQKCPSFIQKRCLLKGMKEVQGRFEEFEKRLANFEQLSADEQELYDSSVEMQQKITALTKQVQDMVDKNKLTKCENATLQKELSEKLTKLNEALKAAKDEPKKSAKLEAQRDALKTQIEKLKAAPTVKFQKKNEKEIAETKQKIEQMKANMGAMKAIQDYEAKLEKLRAEQRGWFWSEVSQEDKGLGTTKKK